MTVLMVFEAMRDGAVQPDTKFFVSDDAWRRGGSASGGSTMFLSARSKVSVLDLLRGVIVQSGNDACIVLAEGLAGSEEAFADMMTERGIELGLRNSVFANSTGLPDPATKCRRAIWGIWRGLSCRNSDLLSIFAERAFTWNGIRRPIEIRCFMLISGLTVLKPAHKRKRLWAGGLGGTGRASAHYCT